MSATASDPGTAASLEPVCSDSQALHKEAMPCRQARCDIGGTYTRICSGITSDFTAGDTMVPHVYSSLCESLHNQPSRLIGPATTESSAVADYSLIALEW